MSGPTWPCEMQPCRSGGLGWQPTPIPLPGRVVMLGSQSDGNPEPDSLSGRASRASGRWPNRRDLARHRAPRQRMVRPHRQGQPLAAAPAPGQGQGRSAWPEDQGPRRPDVASRAGAPGAPLRLGEGVRGPGPDAASPGPRQGGGQSRGDYRGREPASAAPHVRHDRPAEGNQLTDGAEDPGPRPPPDDGDLPQLHRPPHPGRVRAEVVRTSPSAVQQTGRLMAGFGSDTPHTPTSS